MTEKVYQLRTMEIHAVLFRKIMTQFFAGMVTHLSLRYQSRN